jgi:precorrin-6B methylase 2
MIERILTIIKHWRSAKTALSTLSYLYSGKSDALDVLGGLTDEEMAAVSAWVGELQGAVVVEVGTLFGLTAREMARSNVGGRVIAVDNFSWNPFGLPPKIHEAFARRILRGSGVELINCSSEDWRKKVQGKIDMVFFDASHRYEDVKAECEWAKAAGIDIISGHDYGNPNPLFGVTRAVDEVFGKENVEVVGMCWRVRK